MPRHKSMLRLVEAAKPVHNWEDTPQRKLTRERNWCRYVLAGFEALAHSTLRPFMSRVTFDNLTRAIASARYAVDAGYYDRLDRLNRSRK